MYVADDVMTDIMGRLQALEQGSVVHRSGVVTALSPLSVTLGGSSVAHTNVRSIAARVGVGDKVSVLVMGNDLVVLGRADAYPMSRTFTVSGVSSVDLGSFDGDNITGIRISGELRFTFTSTGSVGFFSLRPNGSTSVTRQLLSQRSYWDSASLVTDVQGGNSAAGQDGFVIAMTDWVSTSGQRNGIWFDGMFFTRREGASNHYRQYMGRYSNHDYSVNSERTVQASVSSSWVDLTTLLSSLTFAVTNATGTFDGKICVEVIP